MSETQSIAPGRYLIIGSLTTAQDKTYLAAAEQLEQRYGKDNVEKQLWDRVVACATEFTPQSFEGSHVILAASDMQGWTLGQLLNPIQDATAMNGSLQVSIAGVDPVQLKPEVEQSGFQVVATDSHKVSATKKASTSAQPVQGTGSVPLKVKRDVDKKNKAKLWAISDQGNDNAAGLIDDETLLTEEDKLRPTLVARPDCDVKRTRKACKNCTCGLRELELEEEDDLPAGMSRGPQDGAVVEDSVAKEAVKGGLRKIKVKTGAVTSSCGSCYLGDAFRCSGCPYLGLPAFEPGQKVQLTAEMGDDL